MPDLNSGDSPPLPIAICHLPGGAKFPLIHTSNFLQFNLFSRPHTHHTLSLVPATLGSFRFWDFNRGSLKLTICPAKVEEDEEEGTTG